jgi:nitroreductase
MDISLQDNYEKDVMLMRKYAHIIDKGLHRENAEPGHSQSTYNLLKRIVEKLSNYPIKDDPTYLWATEKLRLYEQLQNDPNHFASLHGESLFPSIDYKMLFELIKQRRSNRDFEVKNVTEEVILQLKDVVNWAANSCNKQPIRLFVTNNPQIAKECLKQCKGGTGFGDFIPSFWVFTANCRGYVWPSEANLPFIDTSLGAQNVFLAATTLGLSGTILSWAQKDNYEENKLRTILNIPSDYQIIFCSVIGYAKSTFLTPNRKKID